MLSDYSKILRNAKSVIYRNLRVKAYYRRGHVFLKIKQYRRAVAEFTTAIGINRRYGGRHADVNYFRAQAYERLGNRAAAIKDYRTGQRLAPKDTYFAKALKRLAAASGRAGGGSGGARPAAGNRAALLKQHRNICTRGTPRAVIRSCGWLIDNNMLRGKRQYIFFLRGVAFMKLKQFNPDYSRHSVKEVVSVD